MSRDGSAQAHPDRPSSPTFSQPADEPHDLEQLLDRLEAAAADRDRIDVRAVVEAVGRRSFGPLLLVAGLIVFSPLSGIPGLPTVMGVFVALIAVQLLFDRRHFWLPRWVLNRSIERSKFRSALDWLRKPARFVDRLLKPRLKFLTERIGLSTIALICTAIAIAMPPLEFIPFSSSAAGAVLAVFGLALIARDGVVGIVAIVLTVGIAGLVIYSLI